MLALSQDRQEIGYQEEVGMAISNSAGVAPAGGITAQQSGNNEIKKVGRLDGRDGRGVV